MNQDVDSCSISHISANELDAARNPNDIGGSGTYLMNVKNPAQTSRHGRAIPLYWPGIQCSFSVFYDNC